MYKAIHNKNGTLAHSNECNMVFGKKDENCPRCVEMLNGAPARKGWQSDYFATKAEKERIERNRVRHNCATSGCGPICTSGDW